MYRWGVHPFQSVVMTRIGGKATHSNSEPLTNFILAHLRTNEYLVSKPRGIETELGPTTQYHQQMEIQRIQQMQNVSQLSQHYTGGYNQEYHAVSFVIYYVC